MLSWRRHALVLAGFFTPVLMAGPVQAAAMHVMESRPAAEAVMTQGNTTFFVRFDGPVDHARSRFTVMRDGQIVRILHPRLNSQPSVLYAGVPRLEPGAYVLHWSTASMRDHDVSEGDIAFQVR